MTDERKQKTRDRIGPRIYQLRVPEVAENLVVAMSNRLKNGSGDDDF